MSDPINDLVRLVARLPGIGERTATRLVFHVLSEEPEYAAALSRELATLHERVKKCDRCGNYGSDQLCSICKDVRRDETSMCVVARVQDLSAFERTSAYRGLYFVLHRLLAPLDGVGPDALPVEQLLARVREQSVREVILATPVTVEGEATALYLTDVLKPLGVRISRIASGVPHGGDLEFADRVTLGRALEGRRGV